MGWVTRFLTAVAFLAVGVIFTPETFGSKTVGEKSITVLKLAHLLCFSTAWGAALWVTFIGGIIMFKNLTRHQSLSSSLSMPVVWKPPKPWKAEYAKSSRSSCKTCKSPIEKETFRLGKMVQATQADGFMPDWLHKTDDKKQQSAVPTKLSK